MDGSKKHGFSFNIRDASTILWGNIWADFILVPCRPKFLDKGGWSKMKSGTKMQNDTKLLFCGDGWVGPKSKNRILVSEK